MLQKLSYRISILVVACLFLTSLASKEAYASLKDIPTGYAKEINYLLDRNVVTGYPDKTFGPKLNVTREEAVTMVGRALGYNGKERQTSFKDVPATAWSSGYIETAYQNKLLTKASDGKFRPKDKMTRGEMAYLIQRAFNLTEKGTVSISDVKASGSLYEAINAIVTAGLSNGYPDGTFKPNNAMTREEFALFVARGLNEEFRVSMNLEPIGEAYVNASSLNVRTGPSTNYLVVGTLANGTLVTIYKNEGSWAYISAGSLRGYVSQSYLVDSLPTPPTPPAQEPEPTPSTEKIIAIDAGHGGKDPGAIGNGLQEKEINLAIALKVEKILKDKRYTVVMTRTDDTFLELSERVDVAVKQKADTFVSIHTNSAANSSASGTETYYSTASLNPRAENSKKLATFIQDRLYKALGTSNRGVKEAGFHVIKKTPLPSALVELGFITNKNDSTKLASEEYRDKAAEAIALGIVDYYNWRK